ncbi:phage tail protein (plasmid) [Fructilactobacillus ixorae]|uniref:Phage tail protein n=1 Tax=Fructilactobacillus ixorae TaxID=1750535 RepID=A0ABY5C5G3_9LACO|nr:phage tail protein [Fructilactobacillus ixorae]USS94012.1 phage tail protein [Fructilactobacillus ixorae]
MANIELIVQGNYKEANFKAKLSQSCVQRSSFYIQWEKNGVWQLQFVAIDDGSLAYNLLTAQASIWFQNQEFIVKQPTVDYASGFNTKTIVATHVYSECQFIVKRDTKPGVLTYRPSDIMSYVFDGNQNGFTWEVKGDFDGQQIENLGNINGQDALKKIVEKWPDTIIYPDNRHIVIYQHDEFAKKHGNRLGYMYNSAEFKFSFDSTNITNQVWCIGKAKDKPEGSTDNTPTEYFFDPFLVKLDESIRKWTHGYPHEAPVISDDRFTDQASMKNYAISSLNPEPTLVIEVTTTENRQPIPCDIVKCQVPDDRIDLDVELVNYTWYPWDSQQVNQNTLNDNAKTIFDYNRSLRSKAYLDLNKLTDKLNGDVGSLQTKLDDTHQQIKDTQDEVKMAQDDAKRANPHVPFGKRWITLGDSITQGYSPDQHGPNIDYPYKASRLLQVASVDNAGVGGGTFSEDGGSDLESKKVVDSHNFANYDFATIAYGTNDFHISSWGNKIADSINYMVNKMRKENPNIRIYGILPPPRHDYSGTIWEQSNGAYSFGALLNCIKDAYQKLNIQYLDWWNDNPVIFSDNKGLSSDHLHPNGYGYDEMTERIVGFINNVYY